MYAEGDYLPGLIIDRYNDVCVVQINSLGMAAYIEEIANILMANLHMKVNPGAKEIELFDFYANEQLKIKLKPNQSLQQNAEDAD